MGNHNLGIAEEDSVQIRKTNKIAGVGILYKTRNAARIWPIISGKSIQL